MSVDHVYCALCGTVLQLVDVDNPAVALEEFSSEHATCAPEGDPR